MNVNQQRISDFDLMTELNSCWKQSANQLTTAILESSNPQVRQTWINTLQNTLQQQQQLTQLMTQKGYYRALPSNTEMIQVAQSQISTANAQVGGVGGVGVGAGGAAQGVQATIGGQDTGLGRTNR